MDDSSEVTNKTVEVLVILSYRIPQIQNTTIRYSMHFKFLFVVVLKCLVLYCFHVSHITIE